MAAFSEYLTTAILNAVLRGVTFNPPNPCYVALFTSWGDGAVPGIEVSGNGYARQAVSFTTPINGQSVNAGPSPLTFPMATPNTWGTITHWGIYDEITAGNLLFYSQLTAPYLVSSGDTAQFPPGSLKVRLK